MRNRMPVPQQRPRTPDRGGTLTSQPSSASQQPGALASARRAAPGSIAKSPYNENLSRGHGIAKPCLPMDMSAARRDLGVDLAQAGVEPPEENSSPNQKLGMADEDRSLSSWRRAA